MFRHNQVYDETRIYKNSSPHKVWAILNKYITYRQDNSCFLCTRVLKPQSRLSYLIVILRKKFMMGQFLISDFSAMHSNAAKLRRKNKFATNVKYGNGAIFIILQFDHSPEKRVFLHSSNLSNISKMC